MSKWVVCHKGKGNLYKDNVKERLETNFDIDSVGLVRLCGPTWGWIKVK